MLGNSIALIAIAAMFGLEAYKASERVPRLVLTAIAVIFAVSGLAINQIVALAPSVGEFLSEISSEPLSWFALFLSMFFVIRPLWGKAKVSSPTDDANDQASGLSAPPPDNVEALESLSGRVSLLEQSLAKERDLDVPIPPTREEIVDRLGVLANQIRPLWKEYCRKQAASLEALIAERRPRKPGSADAVISTLGVEERIMRGMTVLGISAAQRQAAQDTAVSHIRSNALYCSLAPEDQGIWDDPTKKQAWYATDAKWEADLKLIRGARPSD